MIDTRQKWILTAILAAIEIFLTVTNLGYHSIGSIAFTVLHIPVFIATILAGLPQGVLITGIFGMSSMISAYIFPGGVLDYLFRDPRISVVPRLMIPFVVYFVYKVVCYVADDNTLSGRVICSSFAAVSGVIANAAFVVSSVAILMPEAIGITDSLSASTVVITNIIAINIVYEIIASVAATWITVLIMDKIDRKRAGAAEGGATDADGGSEAAEGDAGTGPTAGPGCDRPIKKTFRKWLLLFTALTCFLMLIFLYYLLTNQDRQNAEVLLRDKSEDIYSMIGNSDVDVTRMNLSIGTSGYTVIVQDDEIKAAGLRSLEVGRLSDLMRDYDKLPQDTVCDMIVNGVPGSGLVKILNDYTILYFVPDSEIYAARDRTLGLLFTGLVFLFILLFELISVLVERKVVQQIQEVNRSLSEIRAGNLDEKVTVAGNSEFEELSLGINTTVDALKGTMSEIAGKIRAEMEFAREVQTAVLPSGSLTCRGEFACTVLGYMRPAREVGGDFYDYFLIGEDKMGFVIADVSGKGVPAALFMMRAMTLISNFVLEGKSPAEALQRANVELCENNDKGMFVTVWLGILELHTGKLEFANAAHNPPLLRKAGGAFTFMDHKTYRRGLVLAGLEETRYSNNVISLGSGDMLFLYTDGVTEAANAKMELYGEQRVLECLEANYMLEPAELIREVRTDIDRFAAGMEQYDDITMVVLKMA